jgi:hypothetical protein
MHRSIKVTVIKHARVHYIQVHGTQVADPIQVAEVLPVHGSLLGLPIYAIQTPRKGNRLYEALQVFASFILKVCDTGPLELHDGVLYSVWHGSLLGVSLRAVVVIPIARGVVMG